MRKVLLALLSAVMIATTTLVPPVTDSTAVVAEAGTKKTVKKKTNTKKSTKKPAKKSKKKTTKKSGKKKTAKKKTTTKKSGKKKTTKKKTTKKLTTKQKNQKAADKVAKLIDKIYVQDNAKAKVTDKDLKKAKFEWDKLTAAQKKLVSGENADPEYFGRNTGDASEDNPLNWNYIGENEILVVSFGTSFNDSRREDIGGVERALKKAYSNNGWSIRRAFTSQIIINHVQARDGEKIDNVDQALNRAVKNGVKNLVIQPTHLMHGKEYDELKEEVNAYKNKFKTITFSEPLLGEVGKNTTTVNSDKEKVAKAVVSQALADYQKGRYKTTDEAAADGCAFVFMGHGTSHTANITYAQMQSQMTDLGYKNVFVGTVEGIKVNPGKTDEFDPSCKAVIKKIKAAGYKKVVLRPLMVVAGDHANNDMAGSDKDSWKSQFAKAFGKTNVSCEIAGLGRIADIEQIYVNHLSDALGGKTDAPTDGEASKAQAVTQTVTLDVSNNALHNAKKPSKKNSKKKSSKKTSSSKTSKKKISKKTSKKAGSKKSSKLKNGKYTVSFATADKLGMIGLNDALNGKTTLTVKGGKMSVYVPMKGVGLTKAFAGTAKDAKKKGAKIINGKKVVVGNQEVLAFNIPVKNLNKKFPVSFYSKRKKKWYQKSVTVKLIKKK